jgi:hypothetical protein
LREPAPACGFPRASPPSVATASGPSWPQGGDHDPEARSNSRLNQFFRISALLAGQLDFLSAIRSVAAEVAEIVPYDHLDVCIVRHDGKVHTAYETGIDTAWGSAATRPSRSARSGRS